MFWTGRARQSRRTARAACAAIFLAASSLTSPALVGAASPADPSHVVVVLDYSSSILSDQATRGQFADALERLAERVDATAADLVTGDATVSFVRFASSAQDQPGCTDLELKDNPQAVATMSGCLRDLANVYRKGGDRALTGAIGDDTNYVAALESAAEHVPADSDRPAVVFFTDGKHEADGVPVSRVLPTAERLFGSRPRFALLPVGMGLEASNRESLLAGLTGLRIVREMEPCEGQPAFEWPDVVFDSPAAAGGAVALALQNVTCTFTAAPVPPPEPTPQPPGSVRAVELTAGDATIDVAWLPPDDPGTSAIQDYEVRCRPEAGGDWITSSEGASTTTTATVGSLANGTPYVCEVAAVSGVGSWAWTPAAGAALPFGRPAAPAKPSVKVGDGSADVSIAAPAPSSQVSAYRVDCSSDAGQTWPTSQEAPASASIASITGLTNGIEYTCRAFAENARGLSDSSPLSDPFRPCGSPFECTPALGPGLVLLLAGLLALILYALWRWFHDRTRAFVIAAVDDHPAANLGLGPHVGLALVRPRQGGPVTDVMADPGPNADIRVRYLGGDRFDVTGVGGVVRAVAGRPVEITDREGASHTMLLRADREPPTPWVEPVDDAWSTRAEATGAGGASDSEWD